MVVDAARGAGARTRRDVRDERQPRLRLGGRRRGGDRRPRSRAPTWWSSRRCCSRARIPAPMETCGAVADFDRVERQAHGLVHDPGAARAPHAVLAHHRAARAPHPRHLAGRRRRLRQQGPGLSRLPVRDRGARGRSAGPVKWVEDRSENLMSTGFARDFAMRGRIAATRDGRILAVGGRRDRRPRRVQRRRPADALPGRLLQRLHRLLRRRGRALPRDRRVHEQGAGRRGVRVLVPDRRGRLSGRALRRLPGARAGDRSGGAAAAQPDPRRTSSRTRRKTGWVYDSGNYEAALREALELADYDALRRRAGRTARARAS